jgi:hypothetical protein
MTRNQKLALGIVGVIVAIGLFGPGQRSSSRTGTTTSKPVSTASVEETPIPFIEVQSWAIQGRDPGSGQIFTRGHGRVIVIDSVYGNQQDLRRLGDQLRKEAPGDRQAGFEVHTDSLSATRRQRGVVGELPAAQQRRFDRSHVGVFNRNGPREWWSYSPAGVTSDSVEAVTVTY